MSIKLDCVGIYFNTNASVLQYLTSFALHTSYTCTPLDIIKIALLLTLWRIVFQVRSLVGIITLNLFIKYARIFYIDTIQHFYSTLQIYNEMEDRNNEI